MNNSPFSSNLEDLPFPNWAISETNIDNFWELWEFDIIKNNQGALDLDYGSIVDSRGYIIISSDGLSINIEVGSLSH